MRNAIVVGGGLAGITAALALQDSGKWNVTLFEARKHLGGRVSSIRDPNTGVELDNCQHACFRVFEHFLQLIARCNAENNIKFQQKTSISFTNPNNGITGKLYDSNLKPPNHMVKSILKFPHLKFRDKLAMRKVVKKLSKMTEKERLELDNVPFKEWLLDNGQTEKSIDVFWGFFVLAALNISVEQASTAQAAFLFRRGIFGKNDAFDVAGFTHHLSHLFENEITKTLEESGIMIHKSTKINSLKWKEDRCIGVNTSSEEFDADIIILATPHHITNKLLITGPSSTKVICDKLEKMEYNSLIGIHGLYSKKIVEEDFHFTALVHEPIIQIVFNRNFELDEEVNSNIQQWLSVPVSHADSFLKYTNEELEEEYKKVIGKVWPEHSKFLEKIIIIKTPKATFSTKIGSTGYRPEANEIIPGLRLCGDYINTNWPSTMEGSVTSGLMAAADALELNNWNSDDLWVNWPTPPRRGDKKWSSF